MTQHYRKIWAAEVSLNISSTESRHHFLIEEAIVNTISQGWGLGDWCACDSFVLHSLSSSTCPLSPVCLRWRPSVHIHRIWSSVLLTALQGLEQLLLYSLRWSSKSCFFPKVKGVDFVLTWLVYVWRFGPSPCVSPTWRRIYTSFFFFLTKIVTCPNLRY